MLSAYGDAGTISDADANTYLTANPYIDANGLNMINTQYWIATFFNEYEAWSNYRRTGFPVLNLLEPTLVANRLELFHGEWNILQRRSR